MTKNQVVRLSGEQVTTEQFEEIEQCSAVCNVECLGESGAYPGLDWYSVEFLDGSAIDVYMKPDNCEF